MKRIFRFNCFNWSAGAMTNSLKSKRSSRLTPSRYRKNYVPG